MPRKPNFRREEFLRLWRSTGFDPKKKIDCGIQAGYNESTIRSPRGPSKTIRDIIVREMDRTKGLTVKDVVQVHANQMAAMNAMRPDMPDNSARLKAVDMAYKIRDAYPNPRIQISSERTQNVNISIETLQAAEAATGEKIIDLIPEKDWSEEPLELEAGGGDEEEVDGSL